ncbi:hypothetical protein ACFFRR_004821 [Megaselia abdita]
MTQGELEELKSEQQPEKLEVLSEGSTIEKEDTPENPDERRNLEDIEEAEEEEESDYEENTKMGSSSSEDSIEEALFKIKDVKIRRNFIKYMKVLSDISTKNEDVKQIKDVIESRFCKSCRSLADDQEIEELRCNFDKQYKKLKRLLNKAVHLQSKDPCRQWKQIEIETTLEEDMLCGQFRYKY